MKKPEHWDVDLWTLGTLGFVILVAAITLDVIIRNWS